jgi:hypothetical protein
VDNEPNKQFEANRSREVMHVALSKHQHSISVVGSTTIYCFQKEITIAHTATPGNNVIELQEGL